jgi:hypothetical protein
MWAWMGFTGGLYEEVGGHEVCPTPRKGPCRCLSTSGLPLLGRMI